MPGRHKRYIFLVQGEGRGHMTQAIGLYQILRSAGHEVIHIFIGKSKRRNVPSYFFEAFDSTIELLDSPNFISDSENKSIRVLPSVFYNMKFLNHYRKSMQKIHEIVVNSRADALISFYDFLGGFYNWFYQNPIRFFPVGHQFLTDHPDFNFAPGKLIDNGFSFLITILTVWVPIKRSRCHSGPTYPTGSGKPLSPHRFSERKYSALPQNGRNFCWDIWSMTDTARKSLTGT